ncbi:MAG: hypothetical protein M8352_09360 [ANME-2 cluster archaeon]|nr:hypothetical protein [ANME-2 cluster archaeon]
MENKHALLVILATVMLALSLFVSGCTDTGTEIDGTPTATPTARATEDETAEMTAEPTATTEPTTPSDPQEYLIRIDNYMFLPVGDRVINVGDKLTWRNFEDIRQARILVNENGIWEEEQYLGYMRQVNYTFNEPGLYTFYLKGREEKKLNVTVV